MYLREVCDVMKVRQMEAFIFLLTCKLLKCMHGYSTAICMKKNKNSDRCIHALFHTYSYYNINLCSIFEKMMSFSPIFNQELEQGKLMATLNSRK